MSFFFQTSGFEFPTNLPQCGVGTETVADCFTSDLWTDNNSYLAVNTGSGRIDFDVGLAADQNAATIRLTTNVSDTAWVLRFTIRFTFLDATSGSPGNLICGMSDSDQSVQGDQAQDWIGTRMLPTLDFFRTNATNGAAPRAGDLTDDAYNFIIDTDYFCEISRQSATTFNASLSSTASYTKDLINKTGVTCSSSTIDTDYIKFMDSGDSVNDQATGYIKTLQFWNGVTSPP